MNYAGISAVMVAVAIPFATSAEAQTVEERMAAASAEAGEAVFRKCMACHTVEKDGGNRVGPNLYGVVGGPKAATEGFRYSPTIAEAGGTWSLEELDAFLENPRKAMPGTRMTFAGLRDPQDRANVIAYLNAHSDEPLEAAEGEAPASGDGAAEESDEDFGLLVTGAGVEETYYTCTACHSEMIVAQQGKTRENWDKLFDWMIEEQGMAELPQEERDVILDYLAENYNTDRPNFPRR
ncbi:c-type cytochrome [Ostreiculturibacter nitratireducens]|uniref:c-type cytochrome n=1 Tax=Ostreiculturibacter nitratireducens TaxID=3075226 RepID=UPI0031B625A2